MTTTTDHPAEVPAWMNLDTLVGSDLRREMAGVTARAEALTAAVTELARDTFSAMRRFNEALQGDNGIGDDTYELISRVTGYDAMSDAIHALAERLESGIDGPGSKPAPWLEGLR